MPFVNKNAKKMFDCDTNNNLLIVTSNKVIITKEQFTYCKDLTRCLYL